MKNRVIFAKVIFAVALVSFLSLAGVAKATLIGISTTGTYAVWDSFSPGSTSYSNQAPDSASLGLTTRLFLQSEPNGEDFGGHGDYFVQNEGTTLWYITGYTSSPITSLTLQIKMSAGDVWPVLNANAQFHSTGSPVIVATGETIGGASMIVTTRTWNIDIDAYTHFDFSFTTPADANVIIDTIAFQVVPEPATWASMLAGIALLAGCSRRYRVMGGK